MPWNLSLSMARDRIDLPPSSYLHTQGVTPEGVGASYVWRFDTETSDDPGADLGLMRIIAHLLLDQIRSESVPDVVQTLVELRDLQEGEARPSALHPGSSQSATAGSIELRTAPPFALDLE